MNHIVRQILIFTVLIIVLNQYGSFAQQSVQPNTRHIVILNKKYETSKEIYMGDEVRLKLIDATKVKGHITSIDSTFFKVDTQVVHLNEIKMISTKNKRSQIIVGTVLLAGGIASFVTYDPCSYFSSCGGIDDILPFFGLILTSAAIVVASPGYHKIGKSRFILISSKPDTVNN